MNVLQRARTHVGAFLRVLAIIGLGSAATSDVVTAQSASVTFNMSEVVCSGLPVASNPTACPALTNNQVQAPVPFHYLVTFTAPVNNFPWTVTLNETYAAAATNTPGFVFTGANCYVLTNAGASQIYQTTAAPGTQLGPFTVQSGQQVACTISGYAQMLSNNVTNTTILAADDKNGTTGAGTGWVNPSVSLSPTIPTDLSISKTLVPPPAALDLTTGVNTAIYKITISNTGLNAKDVYLGPYFEIKDFLSLSPNSIPLNAELVLAPVSVAPKCTVTNTNTLGPPSDCLSTVPSITNPQLPVPGNYPLFVWSYAPGSNGLLRAGDTMTLTYRVKVSAPITVTCVNAPNSDGLSNQAYLDVQKLPGSNFGETGPGNNTSSMSNLPVKTGITTLCNGGGTQIDPVTFSKRQTSPLPANSPVPWGTPVTYEVTIITTQAISDVKLTDTLINHAPGVPFLAQIVGTPTCSGSGCTGTAVPSQQFNYGDSYQMWASSTSPTLNLAAGGTITFNVTFTYNPATCTVGGTGWHVFNRAKLTYNIIQSGVATSKIVYAAANTVMAPPQPCNFKVTKNVLSPQENRIYFGQPRDYVVAFENLDNDTRTLQTVSDFIRILEPNYAASLSYHYKYSCSDNGTVAGTGVSNYDHGVPPSQYSAAPLASGSISHAAYGGGGSIIFQKPGGSLPVTFYGHGKLTCNVRIVVDAPSPYSQYCSSSGYLDNVAVLDSAYVNPNVPLPAGPNWASRQTPLPKCFNLAVNKEVTPLSAASLSGPPLNYRITVQNFGDPIVNASPATAWPVITDNFSTSNQVTGVTVLPVPCGSTMFWNVCSWIAGPAANPFSLGIRNLAHNATLELRFNLNPPHQPPHVANTVDVVMAGPTANQWYPKAPTLHDQTDTGISGPAWGEVIIQKTFTEYPYFPKAMWPQSVTVNQTVTAPSTPAATSSITLTGPNYKVGPAVMLHGTKVFVAEVPPSLPNLPANWHCRWVITYSPTSQFVIVQKGKTSVITINNDLVCT